MSQQERVAQETNDTNTNVTARTKARDEQQRLGTLIGQEQRRHHRAMFCIGFPIGVTALIVGLLLRSVPVGTGLAFGGLCTLTAGCYSYWDDMGDALRFFSLLFVLAILIAIGLSK